MSSMLSESITLPRLQSILARCLDLHVGVIGDLGLDAYWMADMTRSFLSRETPRFPRPVVREEYSLGAGANVARNLAVLGVGRVTVFSVLGDDWRGEILRREMLAAGISIDRLVLSPQRSTTTFIKPILLGYDSQQEDARIDFENGAPLSAESEDAVIESLVGTIDALDALLVADQLEINGIVTAKTRESLNALAEANPEKVFAVDSRRRIGLYRNMVLKPNRVEAAEALSLRDDPLELTSEGLRGIAKRLEEGCARPVFLTLSEGGILVSSGGSQRVVPAAPVTPPLDPVGAGDACMAALGVALASGASPEEAAAFANLAAAVTVEKLNQTGSASPEEILERNKMAQEPEAGVTGV